MKWMPRTLVLTLGLMLFASISHADICDDIDEMAGAWDQLADGLDQMLQSEPTQAQVEEANEAIFAAIDATRELAKFLDSQGEEFANSYGAPVHRALDELEAAPDFDSVFDPVDDIIGVLDRIVADCDAAPESPTSVESSPRAAGKISISYAPAPDAPGYPDLVEGLKQSGVYEAIGEAVSSTVALPIDLGVDFKACGQANAFYDPSTQRITMCYEFFVLFAGAFVGEQVSDEELGEAILGAGAFFFLHEVGHALVHLFEIPITGREEDSVDSLATLILLHGDGESALFAAIQNFGAMADSMAEGDGGALAFWDEHSLNAQRLYDVACLVYGSDPNAYAGMVSADALPPERAERCPAEFEQKNQAWDVLLGPYFTDDE